jgi:hypothetical protein
MKNIIYLIIIGLNLSACDLDRDNPLDEKNNPTKGGGNSTPQNDVKIKFDSYCIYSDNNNDGTINNGETVGLKVSLKNTGSSAAKSVKATFSTTSSYVSGFSPTTQINYGDISANGIKWADYTGSNNTTGSYLEYTIQFTVSNTAPANTQIPIAIIIVDESNNTWTSDFNITVSATGAQVSYNNYTVYSVNSFFEVL